MKFQSTINKLCCLAAGILIVLAQLVMSAPDGYALVLSNGEFQPGNLIRVKVSDGSQVTIDQGNCMGPVFSPDGSKVAYSKNNKISIKNSDGSGDEQVINVDCPTGNRNDYQPALSWISLSDGEYIYWAHQSTDFYRVKIGTDNREVIHSGNFKIYTPSVSKDGTRAACTAEAWSVKVITFGGEVRDLGAGCQGTISPNGQYVTHNIGDHTYAYIKGFDNNNTEKTIHSPGGHFNNHRFSHHDDEWVCFTKDQNQAYICHWPSDQSHSVGSGACWDYFPGEIGEADDTPPTKVAGLSATATGEETVELSWSEATDGESGVPNYKVYRNNEEVATVTETSYTDAGLTSGTQYSYQVSAANGTGLEGEKSDPAVVTTQSAASPPVIVSVVADVPDKVTIILDKQVSPATATVVTNFTIDNGITVQAATLNGDGKTITLSVTPFLTQAINYNLTVNGIQDLSPAPFTIAPNTTTTFSYVLKGYFVTSPNGGETLAVGQTIAIQWIASEDKTSAQVDISLDDGRTWHTLSDGAVNRDTPLWGNFSWVVPPMLGTDQVETATARVRVKDYFGADADISSAAFAIGPAGTIDAKTKLNKLASDITLTSGNGMINAVLPREDMYTWQVVTSNGTVIHSNRRQAQGTFSLAQALSPGVYFLTITSNNLGTSRIKCTMW